MFKSVMKVIVFCFLLFLSVFVVSSCSNPKPFYCSCKPSSSDSLDTFSERSIYVCATDYSGASWRAEIKCGSDTMANCKCKCSSKVNGYCKNLEFVPDGCSH